MRISVFPAVLFSAAIPAPPLACARLQARLHVIPVFFSYGLQGSPWMKAAFPRRSGFLGGIHKLFDEELNTADYGKTLDGRRVCLGMTAGL
ncbi:hypothetical protein GPA19_13595 [Azoarcus indigens]|nr:hypothetical protein [Azoarcus indigens]NMG65980.1 hypothetical protein [Azoarcus indigens]